MFYLVNLCKNYEPPKSYDNKRILNLVFDDGSLKKIFI